MLGEASNSARDGSTTSGAEVSERDANGNSSQLTPESGLPKLRIPSFPSFIADVLSPTSEEVESLQQSLTQNHISHRRRNQAPTQSNSMQEAIATISQDPKLLNALVADLLDIRGGRDRNLRTHLERALGNDKKALDDARQVIAALKEENEVMKGKLAGLEDLVPKSEIPKPVPRTAKLMDMAVASWRKLQRAPKDYLLYGALFAVQASLIVVVFDWVFWGPKYERLRKEVQEVQDKLIEAFYSSDGGSSWFGWLKFW